MLVSSVRLFAQDDRRRSWSSLRCRRNGSGATRRGLPQTHHQPDRSNEKERGRIESWRGPRESHGRDRMAENRSDGVAHGIRELNHGHNPRQRAQPTRAARGKRREHETKRERDEQSDQPLAKLKRWHGEPRPALSQDGHGWVINIEESGGSFVENMLCEGHCECQPRHGEAARIVKTVLVHTAPDQLSLACHPEAHRLRRGTYGAHSSRPGTTQVLRFAQDDNAGGYRRQSRARHDRFTSLISAIRLPSLSRKKVIHRSWSGRRAIMCGSSSNFTFCAFMAACAA